MKINTAAQQWVAKNGNEEIINRLDYEAQSQSFLCNLKEGEDEIFARYCQERGFGKVIVNGDILSVMVWKSYN